MKWLGIALLLAATHFAAYKYGDYEGFRDIAGTNSVYGRFLSRPKTEWLEDRQMRLLEDFVYIDPNEVPWLAPQGSIVDGASIPRWCWTWIGSPITGKYRNASIVHDVGCERKDKTHQAVHRMFYDACLAGGVPESDAKRLYYAVAKHGPRWAFVTRTRELVGAGPDENPDEPRTEEYVVAVPLESDDPTEAELKWTMKYFEENDPTVEEIENLMKEGESHE